MTSTGPRYDDLSALFFNRTLKPSPQLATGILVIAGPIWLGDSSSVTKRVIERL